MRIRMSKHTTGLDPNDPLILALPEHDLRQDLVDVLTGVKSHCAFGYRPLGGMYSFHAFKVWPYKKASKPHRKALGPAMGKWFKVREQV
jgi:hypothetical protein